MKLSSVRIFVRDVTAARRFYEQGLSLSLKVDGSDDGYCVFNSEGLDLIIEQVSSDAPDEDKVLVGRFSGLSFAVQDIEATCRELQARGVRFTGAPEKQFWGGILATFEDPSGNGLQLVQPPPTP